MGKWMQLIVNCWAPRPCDPQAARSCLHSAPLFGNGQTWTNSRAEQILHLTTFVIIASLSDDPRRESTWFGWNQRIELSSMPNAGNLAFSCFFIMCWTAACPGFARTAWRWQRKRVSSCRGFGQIRCCESSQPVLNKVLEKIKDTPNQLCYFRFSTWGVQQTQGSLSWRGPIFRFRTPFKTAHVWSKLSSCDFHCAKTSNMLLHQTHPKNLLNPLDIGLGQFLLVLVLPAVQVSENCNMASSFTSICRSRFRSSLAFCIIFRRKLEISQHQKDDSRDQNTDCSAVSWLKHFTTDWWAGSNGDRFRKAKIGVLVFPGCSMKKCPSNDSGTVSNWGTQCNTV